MTLPLTRFYAEGRTTLPKRAPSSFLKPRWRKVVFPEDGSFNRRAYEIATLVHLRDRLGSGGVWVDGSRAYRTLDDFLLPQPAFAAMRADARRGLSVADDVATWLADRRGRIALRMGEVECAASFKFRLTRSHPRSLLSSVALSIATFGQIARQYSEAFNNHHAAAHAAVPRSA